MELTKDGWYIEKNLWWPGLGVSLKVEKVLHVEKSKYQEIVMLQTETMGNTLILDGVIQCTEKDEFSYQEMVSFLPLCAHPKPEKVLIVGGGDGGVAREVAKHPSVKEIHQVEIDERVVELCKQYLPSMAIGYSSPKVTLHIQDGLEFMKNHKAEFDVIITDNSDPVGPNMSLFQEEYYSQIKEALRDGGIMCAQGGFVWMNLPQITKLMQTYRKLYGSVQYAYSVVPSYITGQIGFVLAAKEKDMDLATPKIKLTDKQCEDMELRYYTSDLHKAAFSLPRFVEKEFRQ